MENKTLKWFIGGIAVSLILVILISLFNKNEDTNYFNKIEIPKTHLIYNTTDAKYLDTIISTGLTIMDLNPNLVIIKKLKNPQKLISKNNEIELQAYIVSNSTPFGMQYVIYIKDLSRKEYIRVLSHEMMHLLQYHTGTLIIVDEGIVWKGILYPNDALPDYEDREWERDAFNYSYLLQNEIESVLIPKKK